MGPLNGIESKSESGSVLTFLHSLLGSFQLSHRSAHRHIVDAKMIADLGHRIRTSEIHLSHRLLSTPSTLLIFIERQGQGPPLGFRDLPEFFGVFFGVSQHPNRESYSCASPKAHLQSFDDHPCSQTTADERRVGLGSLRPTHGCVSAHLLFHHTNPQH